MASENATEPENIVSKEEKTTKDETKQFGEESSLDKVALNNKIVTMRQIIKKSKSHVLAKLIRQLKQLKSKTNEKAANVEKNKKSSETLLKEISALKKVKPDTISRFVLGNTFTFAQLSSKGFQTIEGRILARFSNESQLQKSVAEFRKSHPDWKSLAAFLQTQSTGRQIKKNKNTKSKAEKKVNIRAKKALMSNFLDDKINEIASDCDGEGKEVVEQDVSSDERTSTQECNSNSSKQAKDIDKKGNLHNTNSNTVSSKSDENIPSESNVKNIKKTDVKSTDKQMTDVKSKQKQTTDVKSKTKQSKEIGNADNKKGAVTNNSRKQMVVKRINLDDFESDDIFVGQTSVSSELLVTQSSGDNRKSGSDLFAMGSHGTDFCEDTSTHFEEEDNGSPAFANHSMFLSLSEPMNSSTEGIGFGGRHGYGSFGRPSHSEYGKRGDERGSSSSSSYRDQENSRFRGRRGAGYNRGRGREDGFNRGRGREDGFNRGRGREDGFNRGRGREDGFNRGRGREDGFNQQGFNQGRRGRGENEGVSGNRRLEGNDYKMNKSDFHERKSFQKENSNTQRNKSVSSKKLHPSWEASRKRKLGIKTFQGKKITFSDD